MTTCSICSRQGPVTGEGSVDVEEVVTAGVLQPQQVSEGGRLEYQAIISSGQN